MTIPTEFRNQFEAWWDELIAEGERLKFPYLTDQEAMAELDALPADAPERAWIYEIFTEWLASTDTLRWQPALGLLLRERVPGAADAMRAAISPPNTTDKVALRDTFVSVADELDAALAGRPAPPETP